MSGLGIAVASGLLVSLGLFLVVVGSLRRTVRLDDALALLDGRTPLTEPLQSDASGLEGFASRLQRHLRLPVTPRQQQLLLLQQRSVGDFFAEKLVWTAFGVLAPAFWVATNYLLDNPVGPTPLLFSLIGGAVGYFIADLRLSNADTKLRRSATESVHTFFDLVALERLANVSASQAVASAAGVSTAPLFRRITAGVERARMEQVPPWEELKRVGEEWNLPELGDFADVMRLEEQGAALADVLRSRVKELRDAHLAQTRTRAQQETEGLTIWMTLPALLLGVTFITPALLKLAGM